MGQHLFFISWKWYFTQVSPYWIPGTLDLENLDKIAGYYFCSRAAMSRPGKHDVTTEQDIVPGHKQQRNSKDFPEWVYTVCHPPGQHHLVEFLNKFYLEALAKPNIWCWSIPCHTEATHNVLKTFVAKVSKAGVSIAERFVEQFVCQLGFYIGLIVWDRPSMHHGIQVFFVFYLPLLYVSLIMWKLTLDGKDFFNWCFHILI